jgi:c-di-GMP-binding flagellar brake protein YcgR
MNAGYIVKDENELEKVDTDSLKAKPNVQYKKALTKNLSGSGACIVTDENLPRNTILELRLEFSSSVYVNALCVVMRNTPVEVKKATNYELGLHFTKISPRDQDHIIKYIFEQQRVLLKKEILDK